MMGLEAKTIHRLREFNPSVMGFKGDLDKPLECSNISVRVDGGY